LKMALNKAMKERQDVFFQQLNNYNESQMIAFWFFYFHSRFETECSSELQTLKKQGARYPKVVAAMEAAYPVSCGKAWN
jgi:hypothetical protein